MKRLRRWLALFSFLLAVLAIRRVCAVEAEGDLGSVRYRVLAPDWTWQGEAMSVLVILEIREDSRTTEATVELELKLPDSDFRDHRSDTFQPRRRLGVRRDAVRRFAFKGLVARRGTSASKTSLLLRLSRIRPESTDAAEEQLVTVPIEIRRGPLLPRGVWSIVVPATISLSAIPVFLVFLRRFARPGYWKRIRQLNLSAPGDRWWTSAT